MRESVVVPEVIRHSALGCCVWFARRARGAIESGRRHVDTPAKPVTGAPLAARRARDHDDGLGQAGCADDVVVHTADPDRTGRSPRWPFGGDWLRPAISLVRVMVARPTGT